MKKRNQAKTIIYYSVILILVFLMLFSGLQILESTVFHTGQQQDGTIASQTIVVDGVEYYIFSNTETLQATWAFGEFECIIIGQITLEEMKTMIDSI